MFDDGSGRDVEPVAIRGPLNDLLDRVAIRVRDTNDLRLAGERHDIRAGVVNELHPVEMGVAGQTDNVSDIHGTNNPKM